MKTLSNTLLSIFALSLIGSKTLLAQSPTAAAGKFNIFIKGDAVLNSNETEGPVAIGGNVTTNQYQISFNSDLGVFKKGNTSIGLAVRGGVNLNNGTLTINGNNYLKVGNCTTPTNLKIWYRDNNNAASTIRITAQGKQYWEQPSILINSNINTWGSPAVGDDNNPVCENVFGTGAGQIDIDGAFETMTQKSAQLTGLADNLPIRDQNGNIISSAAMGPYLTTGVFGNNPKIIVNPNAINVLTVSAAVWNSLGNINIEGVPDGSSQVGGTVPNSKFALVINIVNYPAFNQKVNFPGFGGLSDSKGSYIIYNFADATGNLTIGGNTAIYGALFAPQANLIKENNGNINGQVIAKYFEHKSDEVHFWPFQPSIPLEPAKPAPSISIDGSSKCENNAAYLVYKVTPNFDATGKTAKIEWLNSAGTVVKTQNTLPLSGQILYPGTDVDGNGQGIAWPGWQQVDGKYLTSNDLNSSIRNSGSKVRITVDATATYDISYPASTESCFTDPQRKINVESASKCEKDAPYLTYTLTTNFDASTTTAKVEWLSPDNVVIKTEDGLPLTGQLLYPGAAVDENGKGIAWPGWVQQDGKWTAVNDANSPIKSAGAKVRISVNPSETFNITYPPSTTGCRTDPPVETSLPVTLASFSAEKVDCSVKLTWKVADAKLFSHFVVERSSDAKTFSSVGDVKYSESQSVYTFYDNPFASEARVGKTQYYRLKEVDLDETIDYSTIRTVSAGSCVAENSVTAYPNPATTELEIDAHSELKLVEIFTQNGIKVYNNKPSKDSLQTKVNVSTLPQGIYLLRVEDTEGAKTIKLIKK